MVFMGTSLADGAWGRESAVYRVSGVLSVIGGWFFTALSAFVISFILANIFYFGGVIAIVIVLLLAAVVVYRSHRYHGQRLEEQLAFEKSLEEGTLTKAKIIEMSTGNMEKILGSIIEVLDDTLEGLAGENLSKLKMCYQEIKEIEYQSIKIKRQANKAIDKIDDDMIEIAHLYMIIGDYLNEMTDHVKDIVKSSLDHVDNNHKPFIPIQIEELRAIQTEVKLILINTIDIFHSPDSEKVNGLQKSLQPFVKLVRNSRKNQIKRIKNHQIGTRNSVLYLNHLGEYRNIVLFSGRMVKVLDDLVLNPEELEKAVN